MSDLKKKTVSGFAYKFAERVGAQGINFIIQLLLARILMPHDYGLISLVSVFIAILDVFVTYGFGNSLVVNKKSDHTDFSTCFYFGLLIATVLYAVLFFTAPFIANYYGKGGEYDITLLTQVLRVMGLRMPLAAVNSVQHAYVQKNMWFKKFFYATLIGTITSGVIAVIMAYTGFGAWALVEQYLGNVLMDTVCLWIIVGWRPTREFSFERLKAIYSYGWKILVVGLIDTVYGRLRNLIIGKRYSSEDLAYYDRGYRFPSFGMRLIEPTVNTVLFPALAQCQDDQAQLREITRKVILASTYIISPIMVGLAVVAKPLVLVLLTEKWLPCVEFIQIGCAANLFRCNQFINNCVVRASGDSALLLKLDVLKKGIGLGILFLSIPFGVKGIAISLIAVYFISMVINIAPNRRILDYGYLAQFKDTGKNILLALVMGACVFPISFIKIPTIVLLFLQVVLGVAVYGGLSFLLKNESLYLAIELVQSMIKGGKKTGNKKKSEQED
jgi:O-antigen/teichoic acid export membrane protein